MTRKKAMAVATIGAVVFFLVLNFLILVLQSL